MANLNNSLPRLLNRLLSLSNPSRLIDRSTAGIRLPFQTQPASVHYIKKVLRKPYFIRRVLWRWRMIWGRVVPLWEVRFINEVRASKRFVKEIRIRKGTSCKYNESCWKCVWVVIRWCMCPATTMAFSVGMSVLKSSSSFTSATEVSRKQMIWR